MREMKITGIITKQCIPFILYNFINLSCGCVGLEINPVLLLLKTGPTPDTNFKV
jgi:hypothetical protein